MRGFNQLVQMVFYKHKDQQATIANTQGTEAIFYDVGFIDQLHANLCTNASENMLYHFAGKPIASMTKNVRGIMEGTSADEHNFSLRTVSISDLGNQLKKGPFILAVPLKYGAAHSVVVIGCVDNNIIYHDPLTGGNKKLSLDELKRINHNDEQIEIAVPTFFTEDFAREKQITRLNEHPKVIAIKNYADFFTIDKMSSKAAQCQAIKDFLKDYAKNSFWSKRQHKDMVLKFLDENKNVNELKGLLENMEQTLGQVKRPGVELQKRLKTIRQVFNLEVEKNEIDSSASEGRKGPRL